MDFLRSNKTLIGGLVVAIAVVYGIWQYSQTGSGGSSLSATPTTSAAGADLLVALTNLQAVKLDDSIFSDPAFQSLSDFGVTLPAQPLGRPNPFSALSGAGAGGPAVLPQNITSGTATKK